MEGTQRTADGFETVFTELSPRVYAYARRQCDAATAQDVVADTFLVAWRRWSEVPDPALPWLLVVARNTLANRARAAARRHRLESTVARLASVAGAASGADADVLEREAVLAALAALSELEREAVLLVAWDGLSNQQAADVAGCTTRAFEVRLSRARSRLARSLNAADRGVDDAALRKAR